MKCTTLTVVDTNHSLFNKLARYSVFVFPLTAFFFSWTTSSITESLGVANLALVLAIITVTAGFIRWDAGIATSLVAATSLNFFHTEPIHSLRVTDSSDIIMISLLIVIGLGVSAITASKVSHSVKNITAEVTSSKKSELQNVLSAPIPFSQAWTAALQAEAQELHHVTVSVINDDLSAKPVIARHPSTFTKPDTDDTFVLPATGAIMRFSDPRATGAVLFQPRPEVGSVTVSRQIVTSFVQQLEVALR